MAYSHDFNIDVGGSFIRGEIKFNQGVEMVVTEISDPLPLAALDRFNQLLDLIVAFDEEDSIKSITFEEKT